VWLIVSGAIIAIIRPVVWSVIRSVVPIRFVIMPIVVVVMFMVIVVLIMMLVVVVMVIVFVMMVFFSRAC